jgi:hypothetical protein
MRPMHRMLICAFVSLLIAAAAGPEEADDGANAARCASACALIERDCIRSCDGERGCETDCAKDGAECRELCDTFIPGKDRDGDGAGAPELGRLEVASDCAAVAPSDMPRCCSDVPLA